MFKLFRLVVLLVGASLAFSTFAQSDDYSADPPTRVARLSYLHGAVSFVPAGENDWVEAQLNRPLIRGDKLWTDRDARATMELGDAALRIDERSSFDFLDLDNNIAQIELTQGTLNLRVRRLYDGQSYEVDTPTLAFVASRVGEFRIDVAPNGDSTIVTVKSGGGDVYGENNARFHVEEGQSVIFRDAQLRDYSISDLPRPDAFDDFCYQRDQRWDDSPSRRYVSEEVIGYQDLDDYGEWNDVPEYGNVWYPTSVSLGWAPYRHGHWAWVGVYGWTWIDNAPWGFAPFHYGRWAYIGNRWGWCPGPRTVRPIYAPALVAFIGGRGVGLRISSGPIGWFPLGRHDVYFPAYHVSERYFTRINVSNTVINRTVINNYYGNYSHGRLDYAQISYANRHIAGALTAVSASAFVNARPVSQAAIRVTNTTFAKSQVHGFARLAPTRASLAQDVRARARPVPAVLTRNVVAATRPPAPVAAFSTRRAELSKSPGRPLTAASAMRHPVAAPSTGRTGVTSAKPVTPVARPNLRVVTQHGTPVRTAAPSLPVRSQSAQQPSRAKIGSPQRGNTAANPQRAAEPVRANPTIERQRENAAQRQPAAAPARERGTPVRAGALNSSRFAHPQANPQAQPERAVRTREQTPTSRDDDSRARQFGPQHAPARPAYQQPQRVQPRAENRVQPQREMRAPQAQQHEESRARQYQQHDENRAPQYQQHDENRARQYQQRESHTPAPRPEYRQRAEPARSAPPRPQPPQNIYERAASHPQPRQQPAQPQRARQAPPERQAPRQAAPARQSHHNDSKDDDDRGHRR